MGIIRMRGVSLVALAGLALAAATPAWADGTVSGSAFAESINVKVLGITVTSGPTPTVTLPPTGGNLSQSVATICVGTACNVLSASLLNAATQGSTTGSPNSSSSASIANVNVLGVLMAGGLVTADVISSKCTADSSGTSGSATLANVKVAGATVAVNPGPNTTINVAGLATVILNEQTTSSSGGTNAITVNAIHIILNAGALTSGDIILAQSHCDATAGNVIPVGTIGVLGLTGVAGLGFALMQHKGYRRRMAAAASKSAL
jgi:hypothetical protein